MHKVWIVDDDSSIRWVLARALRAEGFDVSDFEDAESALSHLEKDSPEVLMTDIRMPGMSGLELAKILHQQHSDITVIVMTAHTDLDSALASYESGAFEYLPKPFDLDEAIRLVHRAVEPKGGEIKHEEELSDEVEIIGEAPAMQEVFRAIGRLSQSNITVLINGESGTGKELVAQALHTHSPRKKERFISLNMASIPKPLIESELFVHVIGAFTGAANQRQGRFEQANGGTLFLDEIGDMPADTQTRLLRVLADGEFYRVGGHTPVKVDVRIIAATHQNLETLVEQNTFREDLFHRLNVIRVHIPKLADRREDIPKLSQYFFKKVAQDLEVEPKTLLPEAEDYLCNLPWQGNVRQLENTCRWITVMAAGREIHIDDLPPELLETPTTNSAEESWEKSLRNWADQSLTRGNTNILNEAVPFFERALIDIALKHTSGRKKDAADLLGWGRNTLTRKLKELDVL